VGTEKIIEEMKEPKGKNLKSKGATPKMAFGR